MFARTRRRLTVFFALLMILFLISFNGIGYFLFSAYVHDSQEKKVVNAAGQYALELNRQEEYRKEKERDEKYRDKKEKDKGKSEKGKEGKESEERDEEEIRENGELPGLTDPESDQGVYVFMLDRSGKLLAGQLPPLEHPESLIAKLKAWDPRDNEIRYLTEENDHDRESEFVFAGIPLRDDGLETGTIYASADVTDEKKFLRKLAASQIGLSALFAAVSALLGYVMSGRSMKPIADAFERQRRFVSDASHELRTPLSVMHASLEVLEAEEGKAMQPFGRQVLDDMKDETKRMSSLVSYLLSLAQIDSPKHQMALETFDIREELEKLARKIRPLAEAKQITLSERLESSMTVHADKERLLQLVLILLDNALQYTPAGGSVSLSAETDDRTLTLTVADTGIGIDPDRHDDIFERFYRGDAARGREKGRLGLGLSIAKWIVEAHRGSIHVKSAPGQGSTFTVKLPIARSPRTP